MTLKFKHDILVRNNRIEQMQAEGCKIKYRTLSNEEYIRCLREKLIEEATEASTEEDINELKKEMSDVLEVVENLAVAIGSNLNEILEYKKVKQNKIGSFDKKYFIEYLELEEDNPKIKYFLDRPNKYPIIED